MKGNEVVRMVPHKDGQANHGHSCVKGRFAWGYATHKDRITKPMIRSKITDPWREVSWDEALTYAASEFRRIQAKHGKDSIGGITSGGGCSNFVGMSCGGGGGGKRVRVTESVGRSTNGSTIALVNV